VAFVLGLQLTVGELIAMYRGETRAPGRNDDRQAEM